MDIYSIKNMIEIIKVEPYWNVNYVKYASLINLSPIKVEPYWNVNSKFTSFIISAQTIKVEPYWNVNYHSITNLQ